MANLLQSTKTEATQAPSFYTDYLSDIASAGKTAQQQAQFVGAQPLQTKAFEKVCQNFGTYQPYFQTGQGYMGQAAGQNITGATTPYLQAATSASPLTAMQPYAREAMETSGYCAAVPLVGQGAGLSGLTAASPFLGRAAGAGGACASAGYVNQATQLSAPGAATGYFQQAAARGGLCAAAPYLQTAATNDPSQMAGRYMSPYIQNAVQTMSDIAQRNIRQNLSPAATAAAVGSGQYGSQRGAQVLGQIQAQAEQDLNTQIAQMLNTGYGQALQAAGQQQNLLGQLGSTAGTLGQQQQALLGQLGSTAGNLTAQQMQNLISAGNVQGTLTQQQQNLLGQLGSTAGTLTNQQAQNLVNAGLGLGSQQTSANQIAAGLGQTAANAQQAQNQANIQAAQTASQAAAQQAQALNQAGLGMGTLGQQASAANLACINALATLGGQQQTIGQNQQMFPLTSLSSLASLLQGYNIPTTVATQMQMSPLSTLAALGTGAAGFLSPKYDTSGKAISGSSPFDMIKKAFGFGSGSTAPTVEPNTTEITNTATADDPAFGWRYFSDGTAIDPSGNYYKGGDLIWSPGYEDYESLLQTSPNTDSGLSNDDIDRLIYGCASGGSVQSKAMGGLVGCASMMDGGAIPAGMCAPQCMNCIPMTTNTGLGGVKSLGQALGCVSTQYRGALPYKG